MGEGQIDAAAQETAMKLINSDNKVQSSGDSDVIAIATNETWAQNDLIRRYEKLNRSMQEVLISKKSEGNKYFCFVCQNRC